MSQPDTRPTLRAPGPARGVYAEGFEAIAERFADQLSIEHGAALTVFKGGRLVVDLVGGHADIERRTPWQADTRVVLFSVSKGFAAMAFHMLVDRGELAWDTPVAELWPGFAKGGKSKITVSQLLSHSGGLPYVDEPLTLEDLIDEGRAGFVRDALERQRPAWTPGTDQGYHAVTFGMFAGELFRQVKGEGLGAFVRRELLEPLGSDVMLGTPPSEDHRVASLYGPSAPLRAAKMIHSGLLLRRSNEARVLRSLLSRGSLTRRAFTNPKTSSAQVYNTPAVRRADLPSASATGSAHGVARAYLPFASRGSFGGRRYVRPETLAPAYGRVSWSKRDRVLQKPLGWSNGFLKEERHVFSPSPQSFGHAGLGGALGWCDPQHELTFGYVMNRMDWRVRSPRALGLCHALYECEAIRSETPRILG